MVALALFATLISTAAAWGPSGHRAVGIIADELLNANGKALFKQLFPNESLRLELANWADLAKKKDGQYPYTGGYHFIDTLDNPTAICNLDEVRDCSDHNCIIGAFANYTAQAKCKNRVEAVPQADAIKFLVHFLGDITQPLHNIGRELGGNDKNKTYIFDGQTVSNNFPILLHSIWDISIPQKQLLAKYNNDTEVWAADLVQKIKTGEYKDAASTWVSQHPADALTQYNNSAIAVDYARESNAYNCEGYVWDVYDADPKTDLGGAYYEKAVVLVNLQVAKAGYRLANFLNWLADDCYGTTTSTTTTECEEETSTSSVYTTTYFPSTTTTTIGGPATTTTTDCEEETSTTSSVYTTTYFPTTTTTTIGGPATTTTTTTDCEEETSTTSSVYTTTYFPSTTTTTIGGPATTTTSTTEVVTTLPTTSTTTTSTTTKSEGSSSTTSEVVTTLPTSSTTSSSETSSTTTTSCTETTTTTTEPVYTVPGTTQKTTVDPTVSVTTSTEDSATETTVEPTYSTPETTETEGPVIVSGAQTFSLASFIAAAFLML